MIDSIANENGARRWGRGSVGAGRLGAACAVPMHRAGEEGEMPRVGSSRDASGRRWAVAGCALAAVAAGALLLPVAEAPAAGRQDGRSVSDGVYTAQQANRGRREYIQHCATCHSTNLRGGEMAPGLLGDTFVGGWSGATLWSLFDYTLATMPQDNPGSTSPEAMNAILAYVLRENGFDAGEEELALDPAAEGEPITID